MKWTTKQWLLLIPWFFMWILYFLFTAEARNRYMMGKSRGMHCYKSEDSSIFIYGSSTTYHYMRGVKPFREYITWGEFWIARGYIKNKAHE